MSLRRALRRYGSSRRNVGNTDGGLHFRAISPSITELSTLITVLSIFGTRPEAIKMAPVIQDLRLHSDRIRSVVCSVGQHRQMLDQVLSLFRIVPDYDLNLMKPDQTLCQLSAALFSTLEPVVDA